MPQYFNINYEFSPKEVFNRIEERLQCPDSGYICVADGNILTMVHNDNEYRKVIDGGLFSICDSSWVPLFLKGIYGVRVRQYCGSQIFDDITKMRKYKMSFVGASEKTLTALKQKMTEVDPKIAEMQFIELPFCGVEEFDYYGIAEQINGYGPDIIWVSLGAPKQEIFASKLCPFLNRGVVIPVGAVFKFRSGLGEKRAPRWIIKSHLEFVYRILLDPKKQIKRCVNILSTLPSILKEEQMKV